MSGGRVRVGTWESSEIQRGLEVLPVRVVSFQLLDLDRRVPYFGVCPQQYLDFIDDLHRVGHHRELTAVNIPSRDLFNEGRAGSDCIPYHDEYCHTGSHGTQPVVRLKTWMIMSARLCKDPVVDPPRCRIALTADLTAERRADGRRGRCPAQIPAFSRDRDHVRVRDRGTRQVDHGTQANFGETGTGISGAREVVSDDHEPRAWRVSRPPAWYRSCARAPSEERRRWRPTSSIPPRPPFRQYRRPCRGRPRCG
jgi:hypothetical protein